LTFLAPDFDFLTPSSEKVLHPRRALFGPILTPPNHYYFPTSSKSLKTTLQNRSFPPNHYNFPSTFGPRAPISNVSMRPPGIDKSDMGGRRYEMRQRFVRDEMRNER